MDKRTVIFILLSIVIWFLYIQFIAPKFTPQQPSGQKNDPYVSDPKTATPSNTPAHPIRENIAGNFQHPDNLVHWQKAIENDHISITLTNQGAAIKSLVLKKYQAAKLALSAETSGPLFIIDAKNPSQHALSVRIMETAENLPEDFWEVVTETKTSVIFRYTTATGLNVYKTFSLNKHDYAMDFSLRAENISGLPVTQTFFIKGLETISPESYNATDITGLYAYTDPPVTDTLRSEGVKWHIEDPAPSKIKKEAGKKNSDSFRLIRGKDNIYWTGLTNKYFAAILVPLSISNINFYGFNTLECPPLPDNSEPYSNLGFYLQTNILTILPKTSEQIDFLFYAGPKKSTDLAMLSHFGFDKLLSYGWFGFISKILLLILGGLFGLFKNYGMAIVALTVIVKLIMFPITKKGQVSMYHLQKLQPRIKALQAQYKNDKRRFGEEQLKLFKEFGVNPLSGCLPMFLQIPVFIGLYWALAQAIELRQSPFTLWITDLSQPDQLCKLPFPILGAHYLHVLPLIMTVSWLIQSLTQPKAPDPQARQQQKMFLFMPLVFGIMFYSVPSGLTLYWFTSTLLGIAEQILIKKYYFR